MCPIIVVKESSYRGNHLDVMTLSDQFSGNIPDFSIRIKRSGKHRVVGTDLPFALRKNKGEPLVSIPTEIMHPITEDPLVFYRNSHYVIYVCETDPNTNDGITVDLCNVLQIRKEIVFRK